MRSRSSCPQCGQVISENSSNSVTQRIPVWQIYYRGRIVDPVVTTGSRVVRIGELARACDCPAETIRYYEKIGLLPQAVRRANGYRSYDDTHQKWLQFILRSRGLYHLTTDRVPVPPRL
jgi:hypothetical protein